MESGFSGSRWLEYVRPASAFDSKSAVTPVTQTTRKPTVARYAVAGKVVPRLTDALRIGERARKFLMGISGKAAAGRVSSVFSGKDTLTCKPTSAITWPRPFSL